MNKVFQPGYKRLSQNIQIKYQQEDEANVSSTARQLHVHGEKPSQREGLCSKGIWLIPKTTARPVQFLMSHYLYRPGLIQTTNRFKPLRENTVIDTERWVPCKSSHLSYAPDPHTSDRILSQRGEKTNPKGTWKIPKT